MTHPDFAVLTVSRELALRADGYADNTVKAYQKALRSLADWLAGRHPEVGPVEEELRRLLTTCAGTDFTARRDTAIIILLFLDGGLRLSELAGLQVADVDLRDRIVYVVGKASRGSGPRHRAVPLGVKAARALDRYLRERRRHPYADTPRLWPGGRGRPALAGDGVGARVKRARVPPGRS
jgi:site-specific recombinase XerD